MVALPQYLEFSHRVHPLWIFLTLKVTVTFRDRGAVRVPFEMAQEHGLSKRYSE